MHTCALVLKRVPSIAISFHGQEKHSMEPAPRLAGTGGMPGTPAPGLLQVLKETGSEYWGPCLFVAHLQAKCPVSVLWLETVIRSVSKKVAQ